jgi:sulfur carrier protein
VFRQPGRSMGADGTAIIVLPARSAIKRRRFPGDQNVLEVTINGDSRRFGRDLAVTELLDELAIAGKRVAIERNGEIVPRSRYAETRLANGDRLEIVVAVGGG